MEPKDGAPGRMRAGTRAKRGGARADDSRSHLSFEAGRAGGGCKRSVGKCVGDSRISVAGCEGGMPSLNLKHLWGELYIGTAKARPRCRRQNRSSRFGKAPEEPGSKGPGTPSQLLIHPFNRLRPRYCVVL
jgi:hypothetical protein